jgi:F-type H+-transporting ATPase subunit delta
MSYVAVQYAEALLGLSSESNKVEEVLEDYKNFNAALDEEIYKFLNHPKISKKNKKEIINNTVENSLLKNFICVLIDNSRIDLLEDCFNEYIKIVNNQNKVMNVFAYTGKELSNEQMTQLVSNLGKKHNRKIELVNIVDVSIVGGIRIEYDGNVLDETINNYLQGLKANLTK